MQTGAFDPTSFTDQELLDKAMEIHKRLAWASRFMTDGSIVEQLKSMADACAFAQMERQTQRHFEAITKGQPEGEKLITPDPKTREVETNSTSTRQSSKRRDGGFRSGRSSRPIKE